MESANIEIAKLAATRQIGTFRSQINLHGKEGHTDNENSHSRIQQEISKARFVLQNLSTCIEAAGGDPNDCSQVTTLQALLEEAVIQRSILYTSVFGNKKKDSLKAFKQSIHALIERGQAPHWISTVQKTDVINHGQEINRLFQILVEGQGTDKGVPLVDSCTLARAAKRSDMFTVKQCESLHKRSIEVDKLMLTEIEGLAQSLQVEEDLRLFLSSNEIKGEDKLSTPGWECNHCTFMNEDVDDICGACLSERTQSFVEVARRKPTKTLPVQQKDKPLVAKSSIKSVMLKTQPVRGSSTNTVWVNNKHIPEMIGAKGINQRNLISKSGALSVYAHQDKLDQDEMCPVRVHGSVEAFRKVVAILEQKFNPKLKQVPDTHHTVWIWISIDNVPDMVGPAGKTVKRLVRETGVQSIQARKEYVNEKEMCPVDIRGSSREAVNTAASRIMNMFCGQSALSLSSVAAAAAATSTQPGLPHHQPAVAVLKQDAAALSLTLSSSRLKSAPTLLPSTTERGRMGAALERTAVTKQESIVVSHNTGITSKALDQVSGDETYQLPTLPQGDSKTATLKAALKMFPSDDELLETFAPVKCEQPAQGSSTILQFLQENEKCFTCSGFVFGEWLESVDISSLEDLVEALEDDDFVSLEMKENGMKYFKRFALKRAAIAFLDASSQPPQKEAVSAPRAEPPVELVCPIRHVLMTNDPVLAPDGYTYEREAIEDWILRQGNEALSPMTQNPLGIDTIHKLVSNLQIRTLARDWKQTHG